MPSEAKEKPFLNFICADRATWTKVLMGIRERDRFSEPAEYVPDLVDAHGRPLLVETDWFRAHIYPPGRESK